ncbi:High mobility group box domain,Maelstrom domain [Cinara cedri]|uniref:High mobility group box domain,Maelstrom domain n=1 Tax=Cinara cedri TaxID=506608 RepID=A0A5E4MTP0_9HEMI|nr:High mobility group box domain,Maelstrom domain [Cinara cedri]
MAPKKKTFNGFSVYMFETRKSLANRGIKMSMANMANYCKDDWEKMPSHIKEEYKAKGKSMKKEIKIKKYTSIGENIEDVKKQSIIRKLQSDAMYHYIEELVRMDPPRYFIPKTKFILIHINPYTSEREGFFFPAEVTMAEFSLEKGLTRIFHQLLGFDKIRTFAPPAPTADVNNHAKNNHQITTFYKLPNNYKETFLKLIGFIINKEVNEDMLYDSTLDLPPIYTAHDSNGNELMITIASLFQLCKSATNDSISRNDFNNILRVYHLDKLFMEVKNASYSSAYPDSDVKAIPSVAIATENLSKDLLNIIKTVGCTFHEKLERSHVCSNFYVCKWIYIFSTHCCHYFNIKLVAGCHYDFDLSKTEVSVEVDPVDKVETSKNYVGYFEKKKDLAANNFPALEGKSTVQSTRNWPELNITAQIKSVQLVSNKNIKLPSLGTSQIPIPEDTSTVNSWIQNEGRGRGGIDRNKNKLPLSQMLKNINLEENNLIVQCDDDMKT